MDLRVKLVLVFVLVPFVLAMEEFGNERTIYYGVIILLILTFLFIAYKVGEAVFFTKSDLPEQLV